MSVRIAPAAPDLAVKSPFYPYIWGLSLLSEQAFVFKEQLCLNQYSYLPTVCYRNINKIHLTALMVMLLSY
ncbi:MAG: hypothetical protein A2W33_06870 [Chloroflexi bacterium RBG_16_52_11]|nr:MAG: hypothetical protein A2W33_06870 [Chloroflexi bacterium RBG_16_52_11]